MRQKIDWRVLTKDCLAVMRQYESVLLFVPHPQYPYDIVQYGLLDGEEYWHSYLCRNINQWQYSSCELLDTFTHYLPLVAATEIPLVPEKKSDE